MKAQVVRQNGCRGIVHLPQEFQDYIGHIAMELYDKKQEMALFEAQVLGLLGPYLHSQGAGPLSSFIRDVAVPVRGTTVIPLHSASRQLLHHYARKFKKKLRAAPPDTWSNSLTVNSRWGSYFPPSLHAARFCLTFPFDPFLHHFLG